jgi:hypothetical protein
MNPFTWLYNRLFKPMILTSPGWPFCVNIDGNDLVINDIVITCFGGAYDPQDDGSTASGLSTKNPTIAGCSVPMNGLQFPHMGVEEHTALDGCPIPKLPWFTPVSVTIDGTTLQVEHGIIDLGPAKQASQPGEPHALDLTPAMAAKFSPCSPQQELARNFEKRGSFRIIGGAAYLS